MPPTKPVVMTLQQRPSRQPRAVTNIAQGQRVYVQSKQLYVQSNKLSLTYSTIVHVTAGAANTGLTYIQFLSGMILAALSGSKHLEKTPIHSQATARIRSSKGTTSGGGGTGNLSSPQGPGAVSGHNKGVTVVGRD